LEETMANTITLTREQLYEQIWSTPMSRLALRYGISDVALAKHCRKHDIPRPPRGHWAKLEFGKSSPKAPLPRIADEKLSVITLYIDRPQHDGLNPKPKASKPEEPVFDPDLMDLLRAAQAAPQVPVPKQLCDPHPLVQLAKLGFIESVKKNRTIVFPFSGLI
jgi:hypothetical protein